MRFSSHLVASALAATVMASPLLKRATVTDTQLDVVWTTVFVTETDDSVTSTATTVLVTESTAAAVTTSATSQNNNGFTFGFGRSRYSHGPATSSTTSAAVATTASTEPTTATTTTAAPEPVTTSALPTIVPTTTSVKTSATTATTSTSITTSSSITTLAPVTSPATTKTSTRTTSSSTTSTPAAGTPASSYQAAVLLHHNVHRSNHSASALVWNDTLADIAASQAAVCYFAHNVTGDYGQNIAAGINGAGIGSIISDLFYNGEVNWYNGLYGQANPDMTNFEHWGHFSQIVWKATGSVACATADCSAKGLGGVGANVPPYFTVCNYHIYGNLGGAYADNVGTPLGNPTITGSYTG